MVKPGRFPAPAAGSSTMMNDAEFENFWQLLDARRANFREAPRPDVYYPASPARDANRPQMEWGGPSEKGSPARQHKVHHRCGTCRGCTSSDCGLCKNCKDKPRFGGPGIKKKACLRRVCHKLRDREEEEDDDDEPDAWNAPSTSSATTTAAPSATVSLEASQKPSPTMRPRSPGEGGMPTGSEDGSDQIGDGCERLPLHEMHGGQLDVLSSMALQAART